MSENFKKISELVALQFPSFYQEEGQNFVQFVKAYYEWLEEQGDIYKNRNLFETGDIDNTADQYIEHFFNKYLYGIPKNILSDRRLLEKHILDVYRSKGSVEGLKLLFSLLYKQEIEVYVPQKDIFKASGSKWVEKRYIEVENRPSFFSYDNKFITGTTSGATAYVSSAEEIYLGNQICYVLYITNITGGSTGSNFMVGERLIYDGLDVREATVVRGSAMIATADSSTEGHKPGDELAAISTSGENIKFYVSTIRNPLLTKGYITFKILDGGYGYTLNSNVAVTYKTATSGQYANFKVGSLSNTTTFSYNDTLIGPEAYRNIIDGDYGANLNHTFISSTLSDALVYKTATIGKIASLRAITSGDKQYNGTVNGDVFEAITYAYGILDSKGKRWGHNADIIGGAFSGNGVVDKVVVCSSGLGFNTEGKTVEFYNTSNNDLYATLVLSLEGVGKECGEWVDEQGHVNLDKYLQDSYYYQEYSYEIQLEKSLDKYIDILKQVAHPIGNKVFGKAVISEVIDEPFEVSEEEITITY
jgi:hypothetical protein